MLGDECTCDGGGECTDGGGNSGLTPLGVWGYSGGWIWSWRWVMHEVLYIIGGIVVAILILHAINVFGDR